MKNQSYYLFFRCIFSFWTYACVFYKTQMFSCFR